MARTKKSSQSLPTQTKQTSTSVQKISLISAGFVLGVAVCYFFTSFSKVPTQLTEEKNLSPVPVVSPVTLSESVSTPSSTPAVKEYSFFDLRSPEYIETTRWRKFTDSFYTMTIFRPSQWSAINLFYRNGDLPSFEVTTFSTTPGRTKLNSKYGFQVGDGNVFSTSGLLCANTTCRKIGKAYINIQGKEYVADIVYGSARYAFKFELNSKSYPVQGYSEPVFPFVTGYFYTQQEGQQIVDILSTLSF